MVMVLEGTVATSVQTIISVLGALVQAFAGYVSTWVSTIFTAGNELLIVAIVLPLIGVGIGLIRRLMGGATKL